MLECLECILLKYTSLVVQHTIYRVDCKLEEYRRISDLALEYIYLLNYSCTIPEYLTIETNKFIKKYCKTCL